MTICTCICTYTIIVITSTFGFPHLGLTVHVQYMHTCTYSAHQTQGAVNLCLLYSFMPPHFVLTCTYVCVYSFPVTAPSSPPASSVSPQLDCATVKPDKDDMNDLEFWLTDTSHTAPPPPTAVAPAIEEASPNKENEAEGGRRRKGKKGGKGRKVRRVTAKLILLLKRELLRWLLHER